MLEAARDAAFLRAEMSGAPDATNAECLDLVERIEVVTGPLPLPWAVGVKGAA